MADRKSLVILGSNLIGEIPDEDRLLASAFITPSEFAELKGITSGGFAGFILSANGAVPLVGLEDGSITWDSNIIWHAGNLLNIGTTSSAARTALELGTAATQNTGTSGANVPLLNGANTWSGRQVLSFDEASPTVSSTVLSNPNAASGAQVRVSVERGGDAGTGLTKGGVLFGTNTSFGFADYEARQLKFFTGTTAGSASSRLDIATDGRIGVNNASPAASAQLDVTSTSRGFLPPRMTSTQRDAIGSPAAGLVIFNTTTSKHEGYNGSTWNAFY